MTQRFCPQCGAGLEATYRFCPGCGLQSGAAPAAKLSSRQYGAVGLATVALFAAGLGLSNYAVGKKPVYTASVPGAQPGAGAGSGHASREAIEKDEELRRLREEAEREPDEKAGWGALAGALIERLENSDKPSPELVFAAIDALGRILKIDPNDRDAVLAMADISFNNQAFPKASDLYARLLEIDPSDVDARARYGSALAFSGRFDDAVRELKNVLEHDPKHFQAAAYLAITYARKGEKDRSREQAEEALRLAPNEEARARFSGFIESLKNRPPGPATDGQTAAPAETTGLPTAAIPIVEKVKANPIAGKKFDRAALVDGKVLELRFREFPMDVMPPFVRDKFLGGIRDAANEAFDSGALASISLRDSESGRELASVAPGTPLSGGTPAKGPEPVNERGTQP